MSREDGRISPEGRWELWVGGMCMSFVLAIFALAIWAHHLNESRQQSAASVSLPVGGAR